MKKLYDYNIGDIIGDLKCIGVKGPNAQGSEKFIMQCVICGRTKTMLGATMMRKSGITHKACGKGFKTLDKAFHVKWCAMRTRTTNPKSAHYSDYGGRGINSDDFRYFIDFYDAMYEPYKEACKKYGAKNVSLERIDVNGNYTKENCSWIYIGDQKGNMRTTMRFVVTTPSGETVVAKDARRYARENGLNPGTFRDLLVGRIKTYRGYTGYRI